MSIAVIGLGTMGAPMAANLLAAGRDVIVHNRTRSRETALVEAGASAAESPADAASRADVVLICVSDTPDVEAVLLDEKRGAIAGLTAGKLVIDCSTISPDVTRRIAERLATLDVGFVDAPVSGGSEGAVKGTLAVMCGGSSTDFERALPWLQCVGRAITHVGPVGSGQVTKAVNQVVISGTYQAVAEGVALASRLGVDPRRVVEAIGGGAAASWVLDNRAENMIRDDYPLGFRVRLHRKDLRIAIESGERAGVDMTLARLVASREDELIEAGHGDEDMSAVARCVRRRSGLADGAIESA